MKSIRRYAGHPFGQAITADGVLEFHAARLLLLILLCGKALPGGRPKIEGLTKLAKLDFFLRYPSFILRVADRFQINTDGVPTTVESRMIRFHYGPWDERYYHVLPFLEAGELVTIEKDQKTRRYDFLLTSKGLKLAEQLREKEEFADLVSTLERMRPLAKKTGDYLKRVIYEVFEKEVSQLELSEPIL